MSRASTPPPKPVWREPGMPALLSLTAAGFSAFAAMFPVAPLWAVHGGANEAGSGLVNGVLLGVTILTQPFVPWLLRRFGTGRVLAAGLVLLGAPSLLHLVSDRLDWILLLAAVRGLGFGVLTVTGSTAVAHLVAPHRHGAAIGVYGAAIAVPQVLLLPAGPWLVDTVGYWSVFLLGALSLIGVAAAPALARALREQGVEQSLLDEELGAEAPAVDPQSEAAEPPRRVAKNLIRPTGLLLGVTLAGGGVITFAAQMSSEPAATAAGLVLLTLMAAISRWGVGSLADRHGIRPFLWPLVGITVVGLVLIALAVVDPADTRVLLFLAGMTLVGVAYGALQNLTLLLALSRVRRTQYGTASAVWNVGFDAGAGLGSVLIGVIAAGFSFVPALLVAAAISLATLPLAIMPRRVAPPREERG